MKLPLLQVINPDKVFTLSCLFKAINMFTISSFTKEHHLIRYLIVYIYKSQMSRILKQKNHFLCKRVLYGVLSYVFIDHFY